MPDNLTPEERERLKNYWLTRGYSHEEAERKAGMRSPETPFDLLPAAMQPRTTPRRAGSMKAKPGPDEPVRAREFAAPAASAIGGAPAPSAIAPEVRDYVSRFRGGHPAPEPAGTAAAAEAPRLDPIDRRLPMGQLPLSGELGMQEEEARFLKGDPEQELIAEAGDRERKSRTMGAIGGILEGVFGSSGGLKERAEDELGLSDIQFLRKLGIDAKPGMRFSRLEKLLPGGYQNPFALALRERQLNQRDIALQQAQDRLGLAETAEGRRGESFRRLPDRDVRDLADKKDTLDAINRVEAAFKANPQEFGPVVGRINQMLSRWGVSGPNVAEAEAELQSMLSLYGKSLSGAAISALEFARLMRALPQMYNRGDSFERLLQRFRTQVETDYRNTVEMFRKQGREVEQYDLPRGGELPLPEGFDPERWERVE